MIFYHTFIIYSMLSLQIVKCGLLSPFEASEYRLPPAAAVVTASYFKLSASSYFKLSAASTLHTLCCILHIYLCLSFQMTRDTFWFPRQCGAQPIEVQIFAVEAAAAVVVVVAEVVAGERLGTGIEVEVMVEFIHRPAC